VGSLARAAGDTNAVVALAKSRRLHAVVLHSRVAIFPLKSSTTEEELSRSAAALKVFLAFTKIPVNGKNGRFAPPLVTPSLFSS
jgi:hypothetical protein